MDEAAIERVRAAAREALSAMPQQGLVGLAAMTECARLLALLDDLTPTTVSLAAASAADIRNNLDRLARLFDQPANRESLLIAFDRFATVAEMVARALEEVPTR